MAMTMWMGRSQRSLVLNKPRCGCAFDVWGALASSAGPFYKAQPNRALSVGGRLLAGRGTERIADARKPEPRRREKAKSTVERSREGRPGSKQGRVIAWRICRRGRIVPPRAARNWC